MVVEILISVIIVAAALYMLYKNIKKSSSGKCSGCYNKSAGCSSCHMKSEKQRPST